MKILIIGGGLFVGKHLLDALLSREHEITVFNRGKHNNFIPEKVEIIKGDRNNREDFSFLKNREFDAVIDTCCYKVSQAKISSEFFRERCRLYTFISTISVYRDFDADVITEEYPVSTWNDDLNLPVDNSTYGPYKALCEEQINRVFKGRSLIIRPGYIVGPDDYTDRFIYWPLNVAEGGTMEVPEDNSAMQVVDVRDLADFIAKALEKNKSGVFNITGPAKPLLLNDLLEICRKITGSDTIFKRLTTDELKDRDLQNSYPLWSASTGANRGISAVSHQKALESGLTHRDISETISDSLEWYRNEK